MTNADTAKKDMRDIYVGTLCTHPEVLIATERRRAILWSVTIICLTLIVIVKIIFM